MKVTILLLVLSAVTLAHSSRLYTGTLRFPDQQQQQQPQRTCPPAGCPIGAGEEGELYLGNCPRHTRPLVGSTHLVHYIHGGREYHFSWCADGGKKYSWRQAQDYCTSLGGGFYGVSIDSAQEDRFVVDIVETNRLPYLWTSGSRLGSKSYTFTWIDGSPLTYTNWGQTGMQLRPQPDNNEENNEQCLAIINHFYPGDTTTWHDIHCRRGKPIICERPATKGGYKG